jgi:hypothetical protein
MLQAQFEEVFRAQVALCEGTLFLKGQEYATAGDRLHNFKVAAALQGEQPHQSLGGMLAKHIVSIFDLLESGEDRPMALWDEKIGDAMNYLFLLKALIVESKTITNNQIATAN